MKFEASTDALELLEEEMSELKTTNRALYRHVNKMSKKLEGFKQRTTPQPLESLEMDKMEEAERMCNALSVKLADMTKKRDNESRKVESFETRIGSVTNDWLLSTNNVSRLTKKVYKLQSRIEELTEVIESQAFSRIFKKRRRE